MTTLSADSPAGATDWSAAPLPALIDHIVGTHHGYLKAQLPCLEAMLKEVVRAHGAAVPPLGEVFTPMREELEGHLMKEEMILFPMIRSGLGGGAIGPIRVMLMEHDSAGNALSRLRALTGNYIPPTDACETWLALYSGLSDLERDLDRHIHLENDILFPRTLAGE